MWMIQNLGLMRCYKPVPMAGRETEVYFLCSHSSRTVETVFLTSFSPRTWIIILHIKFPPCVTIKSLWGCAAGTREEKETHSSYLQEAARGSPSHESSCRCRKLWWFLNKSSLPPSSWFHSLGLCQAHFLYNQDSLTRQRHCWICGVLFKSTLPPLVYSILKTRLLVGTILSISQIQQKLRKVRSTAKIAWDLNPSSQCPDLLTPKLLSRRAMSMLIRLDSFFKERKAMHLVVCKNWRIGVQEHLRPTQVPPWLMSGRWCPITSRTRLGKEKDDLYSTLGNFSCSLSWCSHPPVGKPLPYSCLVNRTQNQLTDKRKKALIDQMAGSGSLSKWWRLDY